MVEKAIHILNQQEVKLRPSAEPVAFESIGLIPKFNRPGKQSMACWCGERNYLCIPVCSKVDFPIYIHKSETIELMKLIVTSLNLTLTDSMKKKQFWICLMNH